MQKTIPTSPRYSFTRVYLHKHRSVQCEQNHEKCGTERSCKTLCMCWILAWLIRDCERMFESCAVPLRRALYHTKPMQDAFYISLLPMRDIN